MIRLAMSRYIGISVLIFFVFTQDEIRGQEWRWQSRLDFAWIHDDNVFESLTGTFHDHTGRILGDISGRGEFLKNMTVSLRYQGGLEGYTQYHAENRMVNDAKAIVEIPLGRSLSFGVSLGGRAKTFLQTIRGYRFLQTSPFVHWTLPYDLRGSFFYSYSFLDYREGYYFDTRYQNGGVSVEYTPLPEVSLGIRWTMGVFRFDRHNYSFILVDSTYEWIDLGEQQKDHFHEISTQLEIYKWALVRLGFSYQKNESNGYGYGYSCPEIRLIVAKNLPWNLTLRFFWTFRWKRYSDTLQPLLQVRPDSESEESSFTVVDISKDLMKNCSIRIRGGWYRNESPFRGRYYKKNLLLIGFTQRF